MVVSVHVFTFKNMEVFLNDNSGDDDCGYVLDGSQDVKKTKLRRL